MRHPLCFHANESSIKTKPKYFHHIFHTFPKSQHVFKRTTTRMNRRVSVEENKADPLLMKKLQQDQLSRKSQYCIKFIYLEYVHYWRSHYLSGRKTLYY